MPAPRPPRALILFTLLLPPLLAAIVQAPALGGWFRSDDFVHLFQAENKSLFEYLVTQHAGHLQVTKNALVLVLWRSFRFDVAPQLGVVLLLHLASVMLLGALVRALTGRPFLAAFAATLWGTAPVAQGTLGWLSVSGQVLCTGSILWILLDIARVHAGRATPRAGMLARWWALSFVACTSFGIGLGLTLALPVVAFLLLDPGLARRRVLRALAPLWFAVPALYLLLQWVAQEIGGTGLRSFSWVRILEEPGLQLALLARYLACGTTSLFLGAWTSCGRGLIVGGPWDGQPAEVALRLAWPATVVLVAASGLIAWRVARARRPLAAFSLLVLISYGTIVVGRIPVVLEFDLSPSAMTFWARYHYVGPAFLAVLFAVGCGALTGARGLARASHQQLPRPRQAAPGSVVASPAPLADQEGQLRPESPQPLARHTSAHPGDDPGRKPGLAGLGVVLGLAWLALILPRCREAAARSESFVPSDGRREHAEVMQEIERAVERTPPGGTAWVPNLRFSSAHVVRDPFVRFPGWAAVFVMSQPDDELHGRDVRFAERGAERLARLRELEPGSRVVGLLVPLAEVPDPPRAELARVLAANRPRRAASSGPEGDERASEEDD